MSKPPFDPLPLLDALQRHGVEFIVVGAAAAIAQGSPLPTYDLDVTPANAPQNMERLVAAQDTGGAIRGAVRADFYWGSGSEAGTLAGRMRQQGRMWILWPKGEALPKP